MDQIFLFWWNNVSPWLPWVVLLVVANILFGVARALVQKEFDWQLFPKYVQSDLLPVVVWLFLELLALAPEFPSVESTPISLTLILGLPKAALAGVIIKLAASILASWQALGVLPSVFSRMGIHPKIAASDELATAIKKIEAQATLGEDPPKME